MIAFEVWLNGEKLCVAGVGEYGVLSQGLAWTNSAAAGRPANQAPLPRLHIGGIQNDEHVRWLESPFSVNVGDELIVKVVEVENIDQPLRREAKEKEAERRSGWKRELVDVRSLLPSPIVEAGHLTSTKAFDEGLAHDELEFAVVILGALGDLNQGSLEFWEELSNLAAHLIMYGKAAQFRRKVKKLAPSVEASQEQK